MKYLPEEQRISNKPKQPKIERNHKEKHGVMERKTDFSFASLQYMKKYNLLPPAGNIMSCQLFIEMVNVISDHRQEYLIEC